jgi:hypothetical protein
MHAKQDQVYPIGSVMSGKIVHLSVTLSFNLMPAASNNRAAPRRLNADGHRRCVSGYLQLPVSLPVCTCMMTVTSAAAVVKPAMTEWLRKMVRKPRRSRPSATYIAPASSDTCNTDKHTSKIDGMRVTEAQQGVHRDHQH